MCQVCYLSRSPIVIGLIPEMIENLTGWLAKEEKILANFVGQNERGQDGAAKTRSKIVKIESEIKALRDRWSDFRDGEVESLDRFLGGINDLGMETDPRVIRAKIHHLESLDWRLDPQAIATRVVILQNRLNQLEA